ncbi:MAG: helix-turn-helix domain-containing protein [Oliverpabstia sp.]
MDFSFGKKVINYRRKNHMTIQELAQKTELSTAIISQIERGIGNPTIKVLNDLANVMGITLSELLKEDVKNSDLILRSEDRIISYMGQEKKQMMCNLLVDSPLHTSLDVSMLTLAAHCESVDGLMSHLEEESLFVVEGEVYIVFSSEEEYLLRKGDSIRIMPEQLHMLRNDSDEECICIDMKCKVNY